jgi:hypothetical protein
MWMFAVRSSPYRRKRSEFSAFSRSSESFFFLRRALLRHACAAFRRGMDFCLTMLEASRFEK